MTNRNISALGICFAVLVGAGFAICHFYLLTLSQIDSESDVTSSIRVAVVGKPIPKGGGWYRVGDPYVIAGRTYVPQEDPNYRAEGVASWYGEPFHGRITANGETYNMYAVTAAHPTLPLPSYARVTNLDNNLSIVVRLNDRGPYKDNRLIDMSVRAAKLLNFHDRGLTRVRVEYIGPAALEGSDDRKLVDTLRYDEPAQIEIAASRRRTASLDASQAPMELDATDSSGPATEPVQTSSAPVPVKTDDLFPTVIFD